MPTYRVERELGGGGMSRVFVAKETALGRQVVVKVLPPDLGPSSQSVHRTGRLLEASAHPA
jgi:serine/threonine-protein kinase